MNRGREDRGRDREICKPCRFKPPRNWPGWSRKRPQRVNPQQLLREPKPWQQKIRPTARVFQRCAHSGQPGSRQLVGVAACASSLPENRAAGRRSSVSTVAKIVSPKHHSKRDWWTHVYSAVSDEPVRATYEERGLNLTVRAQRSAAGPGVLNIRPMPPATGADATAARPRRREQLRPGRVQRQQHGADPGHHGGRQGDRFAGHHPGLARRRKYTNDLYLRHLMLAAAELYPDIPIVMHQDHGNSPDTCASAIDQGFTSVMMDGSLKDDGKTRRATSTTSRSRARSSTSRTAWAFRSRASWAAWARSKAAWATRKTATAPKASWPRPAPHRPGPGRGVRRRAPASTRWPSPSAPATAPTSSRASPPATCWRWTASSRSTAGCPTATW